MARTREAGLEEKIIQSAIRVFGERGFQSTTVKEIAQGADISAGSVYTYFPDKEGLFRAAVNAGWERFIAAIELVAESPASRDDRIAALFDRGFEILREALPLLRGMLFDASRNNLARPSIDRVCAAIESIVRPEGPGPAGEEDEAERESRRTLINVVVLGILFSAALGEASPAGGGTVEDLKDAIRSLIRDSRELGEGRAAGRATVTSGEPVPSLAPTAAGRGAAAARSSAARTGTRPA